MQYLSCLDMRDFHSIDELRSHFYAYLQRYNQTVHSSLNGMTPEERFFSESEQIHRLSEQNIDSSFLYETERRVSADNVLSIDNQQYEIDDCYAKQKVRLRHSSDLQKVFVVAPSGELIPIRLRPLNKQENSKIKRERFHLSEGGEK